jgi:hypothetical protein
MRGTKEDIRGSLGIFLTKIQFFERKIPKLPLISSFVPLIVYFPSIQTSSIPLLYLSYVRKVAPFSASKKASLGGDLRVVYRIVSQGQAVQKSKFFFITPSGTRYSAIVSRRPYRYGNGLA